MKRIINKRKRSPRRAGAVLVLLTPEERDEIREAARREERPVGQWIRRVALREARGGAPPTE